MNGLLAQQGFEIVDAIAGRGQRSLIIISLLIAAYAILKTAFKTEFKIVPVAATSFVAGVVIWMVSGGYQFVGNVVEDEALNISDEIEIRGLND